MKAVILAGGIGTRMSEETVVRPKPMVEIGGKPILWHIMKIYSRHGINDFVICLGYKGDFIRDYFAKYFLNTCDVTFDLATGTQTIHSSNSEPWRVRLVDTGLLTQVGGRIKRILPYVIDENEFCLTYGDGVGDIDVTATIALHRREGRLATVTATQPQGRFGVLRTENNRVLGFREKPAESGWISGGYFVLSPKVGEYIAGDSTVWEREPLERLAAEGQLSVHHHAGFWQPMDTLRDKALLEDLWASGNAPWKIW